MAKDDFNRTSSLPPETTEIDSSWDDDALDASLRRGLRRVRQRSEDDRATLIPELPMAELARVLMAGVEPSIPPSAPPRTHTDRPTPLFDPTLALDEFGADLSLDSEPPPRAAAEGRAPPGPARDRSPASEGDAHGVERIRVRPATTAPPLGSLGELPTDPPSLPPGWADAEIEVTIGDLDLDLALEDLDLEGELRRPDGSQSCGSVPHLGLEPRLDAGRSLDPELERARLEMADRFAVGDFSGALVVAESVLEKHPDDADAKRYAQSCREVLIQMYTARLGRLDQIVSVVVPSDQIRWLSLDHRAGFFLSLVDGGSSIEELLDISGMPRLEALRILYNLHEQRIVGFAPHATLG